MSEFYADALATHYPFHDLASKLTDTGLVTPRDIIADCRLVFPDTLGIYVYVSGIIVTPNLVSLVFSAATTSPSDAPSGDTYAIAAVSIARDTIKGYRPYPIKPMVDGVAGWIIFGAVATDEFKGQYRSPAASGLVQRCVFPYKTPDVTSIAKEFAGKLTGNITLDAGGDIAIRVAEFVIDGSPRQAIAVGLVSNGDRNVFDLYRGKCQGHPESDSCARPIITSLGGVMPDCDGNIAVKFVGIDSGELTSGGIVMDLRGSVADGCIKQSFLPDEEGRFPDELGYILLESSIVPRWVEEDTRPTMQANYGSYNLPAQLSDWFDVLHGEYGLGYDATDSTALVAHTRYASVDFPITSLRAKFSDIGDMGGLALQIVDADDSYNYTSVEVSATESCLRICWRYGIDTMTVLATTDIPTPDGPHELCCDITTSGGTLTIHGKLIDSDGNVHSVDFATRAPINTSGRFGFVINPGYGAITEFSVNKE